MNRLYDLRLKTEFCDVSEMYYRATDCTEKDGAIEFLRGGKLKFDTYFNCLSYSKLSRFTILDNLAYDLKMKGRFVVRLVKSIVTEEMKRLFEGFEYYAIFEQPFVYPTAIDFDEEVLVEKEVEGDATIEFSIAGLEDEGLLYLEIESLEDGAVFYGGSLFTKEEPLRNPKIAIAICTYRREKYVERNVGNLKAEFKVNPLLKDAFDVIVVDNGQTLELEEDENVRVVKNKNLGGSGGFTRGIMEAYLAGKYTHFLLQDDDIVFDPKMLEKVLAYVSYAKNEKLAVGAAMIILDKPTMQHEMGSRWRDTYIWPSGRGYDLSLPIDVLRNEEQHKTTYNAWWFMCEPVSVVDDYGLPLPFFIKGDDIEYSLRTAKEIMTINGLGVWHESFDSKYSGELEYYVKRNELVVSALYGKHKVMHDNQRKLFRGVAKELIFQRYAIADLVLEGFRDFLRGPKYLMNLDGEKMHASLRARSIKQVGKEELKKQGYDVDAMTPFNPPKHAYFTKMITLNGYLIPTCFYNKKEVKEGRLVPLAKAKPKYFFKCKKAVQYDASTDRGFVTTQKRMQLFKYGFKVLGMSIRLLFEFGTVKRKFKKALPELTSFENWNKLLGL
ncbi:MAG: glycosyltransferase family 2 protein [Clostridia bacterium]|nr:glycosyltransferase family 2 protein [Clostridia bacterium]